MGASRTGLSLSPGTGKEELLLLAFLTPACCGSQCWGPEASPSTQPPQGMARLSLLSVHCHLHLALSFISHVRPETSKSTNLQYQSESWQGTKLTPDDSQKETSMNRTNEAWRGTQHPWLEGHREEKSVVNPSNG